MPRPGLRAQPEQLVLTAHKAQRVQPRHLTPDRAPPHDWQRVLVHDDVWIRSGAPRATHGLDRPDSERGDLTQQAQIVELDPKGDHRANCKRRGS